VLLEERRICLPSRTLIFQTPQENGRVEDDRLIELTWFVAPGSNENRGGRDNWRSHGSL
jgi:hypothetical protein